MPTINFSNYVKCVDDFLISALGGKIKQENPGADDAGIIKVLIMDQAIGMMVDDGTPEEFFEPLSKESVAAAIDYIAKNRDQVFTSLVATAAIHLFFPDDENGRWDPEFLAWAKAETAPPPSLIDKCAQYQPDRPWIGEDAIVRAMALRAHYEAGRISSANYLDMIKNGCDNDQIWLQALGTLTMRIITKRFKDGLPIKTTTAGRLH